MCVCRGGQWVMIPVEGYGEYTEFLALRSEYVVE